ncbi:hypothetical protein LUU34_00799000 [Aix galericulata]|nr:hypothetical protein LUU34_00799000 [Aix galericulata]
MKNSKDKLKRKESVENKKSRKNLQSFNSREKKLKQKLKKRLKDSGWKGRELCSKICRKGLKEKRELKK